MNATLPYRFLSIEGNIGAGKTTLTKMLAQQFDGRLILEQFSDNPFLPYFYENPERYAFSVELFFMTERHKQLQENLVSQDLFQHYTFSDYFFIKTLLFAKNNLSDEEHRLFKRLFNVLNSTFPKPDILIYLHRPVEILQQNIKKRGREYEETISNEYLQQIQNAYFEYFRTETHTPILIINLGDADFVKDKNCYELLVDAIARPYKGGMNHLSLV